MAVGPSFREFVEAFTRVSPRLDEGRTEGSYGNGAKSSKAEHFKPNIEWTRVIVCDGEGCRQDKAWLIQK